MESYQRAFDALKQPEIARRIAEDEEQLFDRSNITAYIVEEHVSELD
jgi:hypothetical protein